MADRAIGTCPAKAFGEHRNFKELMAKMSPERRARVKDDANELHREYALSQIRQQVGFAQAIDEQKWEGRRYGLFEANHPAGRGRERQRPCASAQRNVAYDRCAFIEIEHGDDAFSPLLV